MKAQYAKITIQVILISLLAFLLIGCSGDSSHHGDGDDTASISMSATPTEVPADGSASTAITATLTNSSGEAVEKGTDVSFSTDIGKFENGQKTHSVSTTGDSGSVTVSLMSDERTGDTIVKATSNGVTQSVKVTFVEGGIAEAAYLSVGTSTNTVKTDNSDSAEITAVVLDKSRAPIEGISVAFRTISEDGSAGAGQLSDSSMVTDEKGQAVVKFSAGVGDKRNQVVTVVAAVEGLAPKQVPIQVQGTRVELETEGSTDLEAGVGSSTLKIIVKDASENEVFDAPVEVSLAPESTGVVAIDPGTGRTDKNGEIRVTVSGLGVGEAIVKAESLGASATQTYMVDDPNKVFQIIDPAEDVVAASTNEGRRITVRSPGIEKVTFASTIGGWDANGEKVIEKSVADNKASAVFHSADAGTATIQVYASEDTSLTDSMKIAVSATASEARKVDLQADQNVVMPSTEQAENSVTLRAKVKNAGNQVVGNAPVLFRIQNPIGGGEYVSPAIAYTDNSGIAKSTFTSGSLVAGADGVTITAELINRDVSDDVYIVIGGESASVTMGRSTEVESINNDTSYKLPMSVLVTDANGSPVEDAKVTLNLFPSHYRVGDWESREVWENDKLETICVPIVDGTRPNEDTNKNLILDEGEDINQDGQLTPPMPSAGEAPDVVTTDENGVANFNLIYLKAYAAWVKDEITASTLVSGTETSTTYHFVLPWSESDADECNLPDSPFFFEETESEIDSIEVGNSGTDQIVGDGNSRATIRATVKANDGSGIGGKTVEFSATLGSFTSGTTKTTDENGVATITLRSEKALGTAVVTANASGFTDEVEVEFVGGPPASITVAAIPTTVPPNEPSTIVATLRDEYGNPVEGETVNFKLTTNNSAADQLSPSAETNVNGQATVSYTAGEDEGTDQVQAIADSNQSIKNSTYISVDTGVSVIGSITLNADPTQIPADGTSSSAIKATLTDSSGEPMPEGTSVLFETTLGQFSTSGWQSTSRSVVGENGEVSVSLISGTQGGTATVTATSGGVSQSTTVTFEGTGGGGGEATIGSVSLSAEADSIPTNGASTAITADLLDTTGQPMPQGTEVTFETDLGSFPGGTSQTLSTADDSGVVTTSLIAGTNGGVAEVTATCDGITQVLNIFIDDGSVEVGQINLTATPEALPLDGSSSSVIQAEVLNTSGEPVPRGTEVIFSSDRGSFSNGLASIALSIGNDSGILNTSLIAPSSTPGTATITVTCGDLSQNVTITLSGSLTPLIGSVSLSAESDSIPTSGGSTAVTADLLDTTGQPMPQGTEVTFETDLGSFTGGTSQTLSTADDSGVVTTSLIAGTNGGVAEVTATCDGITQVLNIFIDDGSVEVGQINLTATPEALPLDGSSSSVIQAEVLNTSGEPVPRGTEVIFSSDRGSFSNGLASIALSIGNDSGILNTSLIAPSSTPGTATITVTCGDLSQNVTITLSGSLTPLIGSVSLSAESDSIPTSGGSTAVTADLLDTTGQPMPQGTEVTFETDLGSFTGGTSQTLSTADDSGVVTTSLIAGTNGGVAEVTATCDGITQVLNIFIDDGSVEVGQINLTATPEALPLDGSSSSVIQAEVLNTSGEPVPRGTEVIFSSDRGSFSNGLASITLSIGNDSGILNTSLIAPSSTPGTATITVTCGDLSQNVTITLSGSLTPLIGSVSLSAESDSIPTSGGTTAVTADLLDTTGQPMPQGTEVTFETDLGSFPGGTSQTLSTADDSGVVTTSLIAGTNGGVAEVTATCDGITQVLNIFIDDGSVEVGQINLTATPEALPLDGSSSSVIQAEVLNTSGEPVPRG